MSDRDALALATQLCVLGLFLLVFILIAGAVRRAEWRACVEQCERTEACYEVCFEEGRR